LRHRGTRRPPTPRAQAWWLDLTRCTKWI